MNERHLCSHTKLVELHKLVPNPKNPNSHPKDQIERLAKIIDYQGQRAPIVVSNRSGFITKGHGRLEALKKLGWSKAAVDYQDYADEAQEYADIVADNAIASWSELQLGDINMQMLELGPDFDIDLLGIEDFVLEPAEKLEPQGDEDAVPAVVHPITRKGDLWILGNHRLLCGDSTMIDEVERLMIGKKADLCLTDPPYGLGNTKSAKNNYQTYEDSVENLIELIAGFLPLAQTYAKTVVLTPGNKNHRLYEAPDWTMAWFVPSGGGLGPWGFCCWQPILCYGKDPKLAAGKGSHPDAVVHTETSEKFGHPCTKPIGFWSWLLERCTVEKSLLYEPFSGSGTTHIAAQKLGHTCYGMELDEKYCDVIIKRWEGYTGKQAVLESTGQTYEELKAERDGQTT
jgi:DNA modification methylase